MIEVGGYHRDGPGSAGCGSEGLGLGGVNRPSMSCPKTLNPINDFSVVKLQIRNGTLMERLGSSFAYRLISAIKPSNESSNHFIQL